MNDNIKSELDTNSSETTNQSKPETIKMPVIKQYSEVPLVQSTPAKKSD